MNQSYQITVNDSALSTKRWGLHAALLFMGCYAVEFLAYCLITFLESTIIMWKNICRKARLLSHY